MSEPVVKSSSRGWKKPTRVYMDLPNSIKKVIARAEEKRKQEGHCEDDDESTSESDSNDGKKSKLQKRINETKRLMRKCKKLGLFNNLPLSGDSDSDDDEDKKSLYSNVRISTQPIGSSYFEKTAAAAAACDGGKEEETQNVGTALDVKEKEEKMKYVLRKPASRL